MFWYASGTSSIIAWSGSRPDITISSKALSSFDESLPPFWMIGNSSVSRSPQWHDFSRASRRPDFGAIWVRQDVQGRLEGVKRFQHPKLGRFDLEFTAFQVAEQPTLRLSLYTPADDGRSATTLRAVTTARPGLTSGA